MSYPYRKKKRMCAHWLLGVLVTKWEIKKTVALEEHGRIKMRIYYPMSLIRVYEEEKRKFDLDTMLEAAYLLFENSHINLLMDTEDSHNSQVSGTPKGREAYKESYYIVANRKDFLEYIELQTKWLLPFLSLVLSLIALLISIFKTK